MPATKASPPRTLTDLLFEKVGEGLCLVAPDGTVLRANAEWFRSTGFTEEQVVGESIIELLPEPRDIAIAMHARARAGYAVQVPRHAQRIRGRETWWEGSIEPVAMEGGHGLLITAREVTGAAAQRPPPPSSATSGRELRRTLDTEVTGLTHCSRDLRYLSASAAYARWIGLPLERIVGRPIVDVMGQAAFEVIRPRVERVLRGERVEYEDELPIDGRLKPIHVVYTPDVDASGNVVGWVGSVTDISNRRPAEEELVVVTRLYAVLSRVNEAIVRTRAERPLLEEVCRTVAEDGRFPLVWVGLVKDREVVPVASSGRAVDYLRVVRVEIDGELGQGPTGACIREDHPVINDDFGTNPTTWPWPWREATARHGLRASAAFPLHRDGAVIGALTFYAAQPGAFTTKQVELLQALCADVSYAMDAMEAERLRSEAEDALRESDERFRAAFEASPDAININRLRDGVYVMANDGFTRLSGWTRREVIGKTAVDLSIWADPEQRRRMLDRLVAGQSIQSEETAFRRKDGSTFPASISARTFLAGGEEFLLAITRDVSDVKRVEADLFEADRRKNEFLAMLSHELRNPLAPIRNAAYLLEGADPNGEQAERARGVLRRQSEHLTRLVDDLLDVSRITRGKIAVQRSRISLRDAIARAADDFRPVMAERGITYRIDLPGAEIWACADATRVNQVVTNLLHNAAKFTHRGGEVILSLRAETSEAEIRVRDTGAGIDAAVLPRIFDAFMQAEQTLARSEGGLGLGLALVKGIVELHGGEVRAESAGIGKGASFIVHLPLQDEVPAARSESAAVASMAGRRVLVVDDSKDAADSLADILRMLGHEVDVAYDGPTALSMVDAGAPNVVLCDIGLPGMSGYEVAKALRVKGHRALRLVALSGYAQSEDVKRATAAGFDAHVAKPPNLEELVRLLG
jgi:PAS domain S-box-containing protein